MPPGGEPPGPPPGIVPGVVGPGIAALVPGNVLSTRCPAAKRLPTKSMRNISVLMLPTSIVPITGGDGIGGGGGAPGVWSRTTSCAPGEGSGIAVNP